MTTKKQVLATLCSLALASLAPLCMAQTATPGSSGTSGSASGSTGSTSSDTGSARSRSNDAMRQIDGAVQVVKQMEQDPKLKALLQQAKGVFIVPRYGRGALGIGGSGGEGVMLVNNNGKWSNPVFYDIGSISIGAQAGAEVGSMAMLLMNEKATNGFMQDNKFSLTADAGLTIANYNASAQGNAGRGDVIVWNDAKGAFASAAIGVTDIHFDAKDNQIFYKTKVSARDITGGKVKSTQATVLTQALPTGGTSSGASGGTSSGNTSGGSTSGGSTSGGRSSEGSTSGSR